MKVDAILPAGGRIHSEFAAEAGVEVKALIDLGGQTILERIVTALRDCGRIERIVVIGPEEVSKHPGSALADIVLSEGGDSGPANIFKGMQWLYEANGGRHADKILVMTTDLAFVTPQALSGFIDVCPSELDTCLPVVSKEEFESRFPDLKLSYINMQDGQWTIGCAFLVNPVAIEKSRDIIERVFAARKSPLLMARLLGPAFIFRYLTGSLSIKQVENRCLQLLGCTGSGVRNCSPELVLDIDRPVDYHYALKYYSSAGDIKKLE